MRLIRTLLLVLCASCATAQIEPGTAPPADQRQAGAQHQEVVAAVERLFQAMQARDTVAVRAAFHPGGTGTAVAMQQGGRVVRSLSTDEFVRSVGAAQEPLVERMWNPEVRIEGDLATLWAPYDFHIGERFSHCGTDAVQLIRTDAGWKITAIAWTIHDAPCSSPPRG